MTHEIHTGDAREVLSDLPESSVHMCMTSPPYWNLRDYDHADQLGREENADDYVDNIADVLDGVKRVLRPDGSLWLNLGDTYDDKNLQQIPARVALELQDRGWILRNRVTWAKPNPMPQSVKDRLNDTTEAIFHLTPTRDYWYDLDAIREEYSEWTKNQNPDWNNANDKYTQNETEPSHDRSGGISDPNKKRIDHMNPEGKNPGDVFEVTTKPFRDAHFAVYPPELCEKPIKATCPPRVCTNCGAPYERDVDRETTYDHETTDTSGTHDDRNDLNGGDGHDLRNGVYSDATFNGWEQTCDCDTDATEPGIALDPFAGAGTTLLKAKELGRKYIGIELNPEYADMARKRLGQTLHDPSNARPDDNQRGIEEWSE